MSSFPQRLVAANEKAICCRTTPRSLTDYAKMLGMSVSDESQHTAVPTDEVRAGDGGVNVALGARDSPRHG